MSGDNDVEQLMKTQGGRGREKALLMRALQPEAFLIDSSLALLSRIRLARNHRDSGGSRPPDSI